MSNSLVYKSLELLDCKIDLSKEQKKKKKRKNIRYKGALDLIPAKYRIVPKNNNTDLDIILDQSSKITVHQIQKYISVQQDSIDKNIERLLLLNNNQINSEMLLYHAIRKRYIQQQEKPKEPEKTAFTEEDFKKFEQGYMK